MRLVLLLSLVVAQNPDRVPLTADHFVGRMRQLASEGVEVDRLRRTWNLLSRKVFERYPQLYWPARLGGFPIEFRDNESFSCQLLKVAEILARSVAFLEAEEREDAEALLATWLRRGRLSPLEAISWYTTRKEDWRGLPRPDGRDLALLRTLEGPGAGTRTPSGVEGRGLRFIHEIQSCISRNLLGQVAPLSVRAGALFLEDFLVHYVEGDGPITPAGNGRILGMLFKAAVLDGFAHPEAFARLQAKPALGEGIQRLFSDLTRELTGLDLRETARLVAGLPADDGWLIAVGGYGDMAGGLPFHQLGTDYLQVVHAKKMRIIWLREPTDLEKLLLDPSVRNLILMGHGSMESYGYEDLTGEPEETLSRLLTWSHLHAADLGRSLVPLLCDGQFIPLKAYLQEELGIDWRSWDYEDFQRIASREGFRRKDRMILCACSVDEILLSPPSQELLNVLFEECRSHEDAGRWLSIVRGESTISLEPLGLAADARFREALPSLLLQVQRRFGTSIRARARKDFVKLLADRTARYPGEASPCDFVLFPEGKTWSSEDLLERITKELGR